MSRISRTQHGRVSHVELARQRIRSGMILAKLQKFIAGEIDMTAAQVTAALGLLKKTVPDISAVHHTGEISHKHVQELSRDELMAIAAGSRAGVIEAGTGDQLPATLHRIYDA